MIMYKELAPSYSLESSVSIAHNNGAREQPQVGMACEWNTTSSAIHVKLLSIDSSRSIKRRASKGCILKQVVSLKQPEYALKLSPDVK